MELVIFLMYRNQTIDGIRLHRRIRIDRKQVLKECWG